MSNTDTRVIPAAQIVRMFAEIMVIRRPSASYTAPVRILPRPLQTASTPTRVVARVGAAPTESTRSRAKLITELPTAVMNTINTKALQKVKLESISRVVKSLTSKHSAFLALPFFAVGRTVSGVGALRIRPAIIRTTAITAARMK